MATITKKGKANVEGIAGSFDVILYALAQTGKGTHNYAEEVIQDVRGFDTAWLFRNEHMLFDVGMKIVADTAAHAQQVVSAGSASTLGAPMLKPQTAVVLSGFELACLNGTFHTMNGEDIDLANTKVADFNVKLRRYADSTQNTLAVTTPT